jgi:phospho-N-acetylmuramoyl-pentapeptide-transferase
VTLGFGAIGFYDDYLKVSKQSHKGFSGKARLGIEFMIAGIAVYFMMRAAHASGPAGSTFGSSIAFPFFKDFMINLGILLRGVRRFRHRRRRQCREPDRWSRRPRHRAGDDRAASFGVIAYLAGNAVFANYLQINFVPGTGELAVVCGAVIGAGLGFLWFNAPPAAIFMGDTGSLALGGTIGTVAVATKHEIVLAIIGGLFVMETLSVIIQVGCSSDRQARLPDGADPPPFRKEGLDRKPGGDPLLDHRRRAGAGRPLDAEAAVRS